MPMPTPPRAWARAGKRRCTCCSSPRRSPFCRSSPRAAGNRRATSSRSAASCCFSPRPSACRISCFRPPRRSCRRGTGAAFRARCPTACSRSRTSHRCSRCSAFRSSSSRRSTSRRSAGAGRSCSQDSRCFAQRRPGFHSTVRTVVCRELSTYRRFLYASSCNGWRSPPWAR